MVVLDERTWDYVHLNGTASLLWLELANGASPSALVDRLVAEYPDAQSTAASDVDEFVAELRTREYLEEG